jgi:40-residue YVTN family beta-propeller repeat
MKRIIALAIFTSIFQLAFTQNIRTPWSNKNKTLLPNGWSLTPAGKGITLGDLPLNLVISSSGKLVAVTNNGQSTQSIQLIDIKSQKLLSQVKIPKSWYGLKFSDHDKSLYASGGNDNIIWKYSIVNNRLQLSDSLRLGIPWPEKISPAGLEINEKEHLLYVVTKENNSLYVFDLLTKKIKNIQKMDGEGYTCLLSPDKSKLYVSCWGCGKVLVYDPKTIQQIGQIEVGSNPNDLCITKKGDRLFVANSNDNSVSVISTAENKVIETLDAALYPNSPSGSTTNALALSPNDKTLYIANADNNCLAVYDISKWNESQSRGFIPVGWYPTNVKVVGNKILVANGKGFTSMANPNGPSPMVSYEKVSHAKGNWDKYEKVQYIGRLFKGTLSFIDVPSTQQLSAYSKQVYSNSPYTPKSNSTLSAIKNPFSNSGAGIPIKHVFYIIKENRTYDQVLGDMKEGNGDPSLVLFGEKVTPNQHALAKQFVLLDNFYCDAEVSADGHNWSMGSYANDYLEKTWPTSYGSRGGNYDSEGNRPIANNKNGFIWDFCKRAGVSYRTYGEFADDYKPNIPVLKDHYCPYYTSWDQHVRDTTRVNQWKRDFDSLLAVGAVPQLNTLRLINDHTEGLSAGRPSPLAHVADNDWAVGMFIEYLSKSPIWKESVVFILEDDAQNGPDHVDAHRTTAYIAGGFIKRGFVDHTMYSTTSMVHTIELILGLPPMSQYDAAATPMWNCFSSTPDLTPFKALPAKIDITNKNIAFNEWQRRSELFNFTKEDAVPDLEFNLVLWHGIKGDVPYPGPKRAAFVNANKKDSDD